MGDLLPSLPQLLMLVGMGVMIWTLLRRSSRYFGNGGKANEPSQKLSARDTDRDRTTIDAPPDVTRWQVEMYETARDLKGEIDTKLAVLQILVRHANEASARLEAAIDRTEKLGLHSALDPLSAIETWDETDPTIQPSTHHTSQPHPQSPMIYALADEGRDAAAIAQQTGLPLGEVEMVLSLREKV